MLQQDFFGIRFAAWKLAKENNKDVYAAWVECVILVACLWALPANAGDESLASPWLVNFQKAETLAREHQVPMLIHFHAHWCGPCQTMESEVLNTAEVRAALGSGIIGVKVNADDRQDLVSQFGVTALPTDFIVSAGGQVLSKHVGSQGRTAFVARLAQFRVPARVPAGMPDRAASAVGAIVETAPAVNDTAPENVAATAAPEKTITAMTKALRGESAGRIGLNGYSPVSLTETEEWKTGVAQFKHEFQGVSYQLSSAEELERFKARPEKFIPALHGCDPVALVEDHIFQAGHLELGVTYDSKVYFFVSKNTRDEFLSKPEQYSGQLFRTFFRAKTKF